MLQSSLHMDVSDVHVWPDGFWDIYGASKDESFVVPPELDGDLDQSVCFDEPAFEGLH